MWTLRDTSQKNLAWGIPSQFQLSHLHLGAIPRKIWSGELLFTITPTLRDMSLSARSSEVPHPLSALCAHRTYIYKVEIVNMLFSVQIYK